MKKVIKLIFALSLIFFFAGCTINPGGTNRPNPNLPKEFTLPYDGNGATSGAVPNTKKFEKITLSYVDDNINNLVKTGYTFKDWNTKKDGLGTTYIAGENIKINGKITLYAIWEAIRCTITYDANDATSGIVPSANVENMGTTISVKNKNNLVKTGYVFNGWNTQADGLGDSYAVGSNLVLNSDITLYAIWELIPIETFTITYNSNGATSGNVPNSETKNIGTTISVSANIGNLTKTGYNFKQWNSQANGLGTTYLVGSNLVLNNNIILYAIWELIPIEYSTITYYPNGATSGAVPNSRTEVKGTNISIEDNIDLIKEGYSFNGWNSEANGLGTTYLAGSSLKLNADTKLYAIWIETYTIKYYANGATNGNVPSSITQNKGTNITILGNSGLLEKTGYFFGGWNSQIDGLGEEYNPNQVIVLNNNLNLYAIWKEITPNKFTITYNENGADGGNIPSVSEWNEGEYAIIANNEGNLIKTGYVFSGWSLQSGVENELYMVNLNIIMNDDITLYAIWIKLFNINFNGNNADSGFVPNFETKIKGSIITIPGNEGNLYKYGFIFNGWNSKADGTGSNYLANEEIELNNDINLYANWVEKIKYTLTYNPNNATSGQTPNSQETYEGESIIILGNTGELQKNGYVFLGWNSQSNGKGNQYNSGDNLILNSNIILYANWVDITRLSVTYIANDKTSGSVPNEEEYDLGTLITISQNVGNLKKQDDIELIVGAWNTNTDGTGTIYSFGSATIILENLILYPIWIDPYKINFDYIGNNVTEEIINSNSYNNFEVIDDGFFSYAYHNYPESEVGGIVYTKPKIDGKFVLGVDYYRKFYNELYFGQTQSKFNIVEEEILFDYGDYRILKSYTILENIHQYEDPIDKTVTIRNYVGDHTKMGPFILEDRYAGSYLKKSLTAYNKAFYIYFKVYESTDGSQIPLLTKNIELFSINSYVDEYLLKSGEWRKKYGYEEEPVEYFYNVIDEELYFFIKLPIYSIYTLGEVKGQDGPIIIRMFVNENITSLEYGVIMGVRQKTN